MVLAFLYIPLGDALIPTTLPEVRTPKVQVHPVPRTQLVWKVRAWGVGHEPRTAPRGQAGSDGGLGPAPRPILPLWLGSQGFWAGLAGGWGQGRSTCSVHQNHQGWPCPGSHPSLHRIATGSTPVAVGPVVQVGALVLLLRGPAHELSEAPPTGWQCLG